MRVTETALPGVLLLEPRVFRDSRGAFLEVWQQERYAGLGIAPTFVQDNVSRSAAGVLRGLHVQYPQSQGKLVSVLRGEVFDVAVDIRRGSPTYLRWVGCRLSCENAHQLYVPAGFAHGFVVTSDEAVVFYKCTVPYRAEFDLSIAWNDPEIGVEWPVAAPTLSDKDARAQPLRAIAPDRLPSYAD